MSSYFCELALDHEPLETCSLCKLKIDEYGNTEEDFLNCSFPACGCDGERNCMAGNSNQDAKRCNVEGMWNSGGKKNIRARLDLCAITHTHKDSK